MKVVILGGGIAGLTMGVFLQRNNIDVVVNERCTDIPEQGLAFLMHSEGLAILNEIKNSTDKKLPATTINTFSFLRPDEKKIKHMQLNSWQCLKRSNLIKFLYDIFPENCLKKGRTFSHFLYENDKAVAAVFLNGDVEYGDIFVGSDGANSLVREAILGKTEFTQVKVKEIVGISHNAELATLFAEKFTKYQNYNTGLAFGFIPTSPDELVWFIQYDPSISDVPNNTPEDLKLFCQKLLKDFPPVVTELMETNDFFHSYIWNTRDFDLLPTFHKKNVVLIGDAAHQALPFTSSGTTNAILDAKLLASKLANTEDYETAFQSYYIERSGEILKHIQLGRDLQYVFLHPQAKSEDEIQIPLIKFSKRKKALPKHEQIHVLYFTDPICSTCWITQPTLRKLKLEYDEYLNIEYRMGGLLPSWEQYNKGIIKQPSDAAKHWEEVCAFHEMPLDGDVWNEDPLLSSFPPSIAFKAAQMQDPYLAIIFLRRITEMVFVEKKNINKWEFIEKAAFDSGLDTVKMLRDYEGKAVDLFREDLLLAQQLGVNSFPTLFFSDSSNNTYTLKGYKEYEQFEEIILKLNPLAKKNKIDADPAALFSSYPTMTNKEFAFLSNLSKDNAGNLLTALFEQGCIAKYESKNGIIWKNRFDKCSPEFYQ